MSSIASLDAAAAARKERLAQLKSLKRKQPLSSTDTDTVLPDAPSSNAPSKSPSPSGGKDTSHLLSGRNYDIESRAPKMGFAQAPTEGVDTLEALAAEIVTRTKEQQLADEKSDKAIDLFSLQPKRPNWDLKRDVDKKLERLNAKTDVAIAKIIRARIEEAKKKKSESKDDGDEAAGVEGNLGAMVIEREKEAERERETGEGDSDSEEL